MESDGLVDVADASFILFPEDLYGCDNVNIVKWATDCVNELFNDYWQKQTKEQTRMTSRIIREVKSYYPDFERKSKVKFLKQRPVLSSIKATTWFVLDKLKSKHFPKLIASCKYFHPATKQGSVIYRRAEFGKLFICYTDKGSVNVFGPKSFAQLQRLLAVFLQDICQNLDSVLKNATIAVHELGVDNTVMKSKQPDVTLDIPTLCAKLIECNVHHSLYNGTVTLYPFPKSYPGCALRIFRSGAVLCMGTAPRSVKAVAFHFADQLVSYSIEHNRQKRTREEVDTPQQSAQNEKIVENSHTKRRKSPRI